MKPEDLPTGLRAIFYPETCCRDNDYIPYTCEFCTFGKLDQPYEEVWNDLAEAYYRCSFLNIRLWGENPKCTKEMWVDLARKELELILCTIPENQIDK